MYKEFAITAIKAQPQKGECIMTKVRFTLNILAITVFTLMVASMAQAQATRTWVSGVGDDVNPCSRTAPCKTFAGAISKTARFGEISCLDPGGFGAVTITKSITIDCHDILASILHSSTNGVNINYDSFDQVADTRKTVRLRSIEFIGANTGNIGVNITGNATNSAGSEVYIEDCLMDGNFGGATNRGIFDNRGAAGAVLSVRNTTVRNMASTGISIAGAGALNVTISNSLISNCAFGVAAANGASKIQVYNTVLTNNTTNGVRSDGPAGQEISVDHCVVSNNTGFGFLAQSGGIIRVSNTTAINNAGGLSSGNVSSYGNNQTGGNAFSGTGTGPN
jgi:hypothetical protein